MQDTRNARRIDAHVHVWDLARRDVPWIDEARSAIRRTFAVADWVQVADATDVDSAVLVQAINERPHGRCLVGIRHLALVDNDPAGWLGSPQVQRGLVAVAAAQLPYDLIFRPEHGDAVLHTVRSHPDMTFVVDHLGKPPTLPTGLDDWAIGIRTLAAEPNVTCKLSQILTVAGPARPFVDIALEAFGAERVMFGSDWPVSLLHAPYGVVVEVAEQLLEPTDQAQVFGRTAERVYALY
jgi:L-fuconolactonase